MNYVASNSYLIAHCIIHVRWSYPMKASMAMQRHHLVLSWAALFWLIPWGPSIPAPSQLCYLSSVVHVTDLPGRRALPSVGSTHLLVPPSNLSTVDGRAFPVNAAQLWTTPAVSDYKRPRTRLNFGERSFSCTGPRTWNSLPSSLQELTDTKTFKRKLKTFLFQQAYHWTCVVLSVSFHYLPHSYSI